MSAITQHVDSSLPPLNNVSALFQLDNGCLGVSTLLMSWTPRKVSWFCLHIKHNQLFHRCVILSHNKYADCYQSSRFKRDNGGTTHFSGWPIRLYYKYHKPC
eukprot:TRINITY_DN3501_c0_g2_i1.p1 TRINITY_DN3501_c0_g2~~TRINITY_DN3501_c0_g2_i1.p1  ORF type:complete len:102 (-),score=2.66 TRINITY_DN3501_c0_g2_i1:5-310(-)